MRLPAAPAVSAALTVAVIVGAPGAAATTAYTLEPLNFNIIDSTANLFDGAICEVYSCVRVPTKASLDLSYRNGVFGEDGPISEGATTLNDRLAADSGQKLVFGYSQGAQIANFWLRNYAPTSSVQQAATSLLLVGDPENTYGVPWTPNVPTNTGFAVTEIWSQYDGWADWPTRFTLLAAANAVAGMFLSHPVVYDHLNLAAEQAVGNVVSWSKDGIDYQMVRNDQLPLLTPLRWVGLGAVADSLDAPLRKQIEASYDRPSTQRQADATFGTRPSEHRQPTAAVRAAVTTAKPAASRAHRAAADSPADSAAVNTR